MAQVVFKSGQIIYIGNSPENAANAFKTLGGDDISTIKSLPELVNLFLEKNGISEPKMTVNGNWFDELFPDGTTVEEAEKTLSEITDKIAKGGKDAISFTRKTSANLLSRISKGLKLVSEQIDEQVKNETEEKTPEA